jgi:hypothetical protein
MKAWRGRLLPFASCGGLLLVVHLLVGAGLSETDPLALLLRGSAPVVMAAVLGMLGARFLLLFAVPGWGLYVFLTALAERFLGRKPGSSGTPSENRP